jgi:hypothetical protein
VKKFISTYPVVFGSLIGLFILVTIFVIVIWVPGTGESARRHKFLLEVVWGTLALFAVSLNRFWPLRRRSDFWTILFTIFSLHFLGLYLYTASIHILTMGQLTVLMLAELFLIFSIVPRSTKYLSRASRRGRAG